MKLLSKSKKHVSTPFSDFIRNASSREKKRVYNEVLKTASETQNELVRKYDQQAIS